MLKAMRIICSIAGVLIAIYNLWTENFEFQFLLLGFLGLIQLFNGLEEFQNGKRATGWFSIAAFLFLLFVSIKIY